MQPLLQLQWRQQTVEFLKMRCLAVLQCQVLHTWKKQNKQTKNTKTINDGTALKRNLNAIISIRIYTILWHNNKWKKSESFRIVNAQFILQMFVKP